MIEQTYPSGRIVKNVIDNNGYLSMVQSAKCMEASPATNATCTSQAGLWNYAHNFTYNAAGAVTSMQLGNGRWESTTFNSRLQPTQIALGTVQNGTDKLKLEYGYGTTANNGNVISQTITVPTVGVNPGFTAIQSYSYDSLNRLESAEETISSVQTWKQAFTFDRYGNRNFDEEETTTIPKNCGTSPNFTVCAADKKIVNPSINTANNRLSTSDDYVFDNAGNTTEDAHGRTFIYDAENKQVEVKDQYDNTIGEYFYDGDGKRIKKYVPNTSEVTIFVYDAAGKLVAEYSTIQPIAPKVSYTTADHLGSPRILTDENGATISRRDFYPFGEEILTEHRILALGYQPDDMRQKFTTYERDTETDLDFAQARYYNKRHGRFTSPDEFKGNPIAVSLYNKEEQEQALPYADIKNPQSLNKYQYCFGNPLLFIDPTGHKVELTNDNAADRNEVKARLLYNLAKSERKYFEVKYDKNKKVYSLELKGDVNKALSKNHTKAFEYLVEAVKNDKVIGVEIGEKYRDDNTFGRPERSVREYAGGGVALYGMSAGSRGVQVILARDGAREDVLGSDGVTRVHTPRSIVAAHEVLGHARLRILGKVHNEKAAREVENEVRRGRGLAERYNP